MALTPSVSAGAQWNYLVAMLKSEAGLGSAPPGTVSGPPAGR